jgi:Undecaprenyl-phosphate glucose phosphotransferase
MTTSAWAGRERSWLSEQVVAGLMRVSDCLVVAAAAGLAYLHDPAPVTQSAAPLLLIIAVLLMPQVSSLFGVYSASPRPDPASPLRIFGSWVCVIGVLAVVQLLSTPDGTGLSTWIALWFTYGLAGLLFTHFLYNRRVRQWYRRGDLARRLVIAGMDDYAVPLARHLWLTRDESVRVLGLFCNPAEVRPRSAPPPYPILGAWEDLEAFVRGHRVDAVVLAIPWHAEDCLQMWMARLRNLPVDVLLCPPASSAAQTRWGVSSMAGHRFLKVSERPLAGWRYIAKAIEDRLLALGLLVLLAPVMLAIAILVRLDSPGPVLFRQKRYGFNNMIIEILKFRTMVAGDEPAGGVIQQARRHDPRLTRTGHWLRKTSLDELPQLFNVLRGEMSLVGPRPHAISHNEQYAPIIDAYVARHRMKPGITGWAQVNGFRGETDTLEKMENRVKYDLYYIEHWSILLDLYILLRTLFVGFVHPNAY